MKLIFIYGPPASGKLTVAEALAELTGFPVFHNHVTRDLVQGLYPGELAANYQLVDELREAVLGYCARRGTSVIFTFVYDGPQDDDVVRKRLDAVMANGGEVLLVELHAPHDVLLQRVSEVSRAKHNKLTDRDILASLLQRVPYPSLPYAGVFTVDTSKHEPKDAAALIAGHYGLPAR
ncbi:AAA family ATPase [Mycolicibacterium litorale]|uniref:AAA family ATPase n=1 Tax=Mycolicibacterium litorale TaxID=758802 RepID=UPI003CF1522A